MTVTRDTLKHLGFKQTDKASEWVSDTEYEIRVTYRSDKPELSRIDYGKLLTVHHKGTSNFKQPENLVVLECVLRLLRKGYPPKSIELEKTWKAGHGKSGRLDIFLRKQRRAYGMIECKTWGEEYLKERDNILGDGGQLFSYLIQEKATEIIVLYSSKIDDRVVTTQAEAIDASKFSGSNQEELHKSWDRSFIPDGIFDVEAAPYFSQKRNLKKSNLQELDRDSGRGLFNSFAEILRRHVISDKSNAFNKIFNLFVCKIYDEDTKAQDDELDFQWKTGDTYEALIKRLGMLYMHGLKDYLLIDITDDYFSPYAEFAFIDIFNLDSFEENFTVIKEVVELLQSYQIKYTSKHQFLGDFFEKLLNTGIKQEAGQFFTPIPLARFFLKSIPLDQIMESNISAKSQHVLPFIVDYACGSGHFLTEAIDELEEFIDQVDVKRLVGRIQKNFLAIKENFYWAKDYVYGVEKDYRLAKTTKIAMFLNGDGDAIIINGDSLDDFAASDTFTGLLTSKVKTRENPQFDVLVSNPPFSIAGFRQYVVNGADNFALHRFLTSKSSEIECLFLERAQHLLKEGGFGGIILPLSILNSEISVYTAARRKLLIDFELNAVVELRDKTFIATNTTTVGVFVRKRSKHEIRKGLAAILEHYVRGTKVKDLEASVTALMKSCPACEPTPDEIKGYFAAEGLNQTTLKKHEPESTSYPPAVAYALIAYLNRGHRTVIAYAGEKKEQEDFLGYRFSNSRGKEGIEFFHDKGKIKTALYDPGDLNNAEKVNAHIRANVADRTLPIPDALANRVAYVETLNLINSASLCLNNPSSYFESDSYVIESNSRFGDIINDVPQKKVSVPALIKKRELQYISGLTYNKTDEVPRRTSKRVLTASNIDLKTGRVVYGTKIIYLREDFILPPEMKARKGDIIISNASGSLKHLGKCAYVEEDIDDAAIGGFLSILRPKDDALGKAVFYRLLSLQFRKYIASLRDQNINNMNLAELSRFPLSLPRNLKSFLKTITEKESELKEVESRLAALRSSGDQFRKRHI